MRRPVSDAIVFFGATGDLAYKQIFPALQGLIRDEGLDIPIIGVAKAGWSLDQLKARAEDSLCTHGGLDTKAFAKLTRLLRYVDGDYSDPSTYVRLRQELEDTKRPLHYLAIPPSLFATVAEGLAKQGAGANARLVVEKPFGRDRESARQLDRILNRFFPEDNIPDRSLSRQGAGAEHSLYPICECDVRTDLEPHLHQQYSDHHG
jgi:glucose-6-phosphate 1-dehydrogenase